MNNDYGFYNFSLRANNGVMVYFRARKSRRSSFKDPRPKGGRHTTRSGGEVRIKYRDGRMTVSAS